MLRLLLLARPISNVGEQGSQSFTGKGSSLSGSSGKHKHTPLGHHSVSFFVQSIPTLHYSVLDSAYVTVFISSQLDHVTSQYLVISNQGVKLYLVLQTSGTCTLVSFYMRMPLKDLTGKLFRTCPIWGLLDWPHH